MTTDNDFVAEKLGLWKHGQGSRHKHTYYGNTIPAPDLLANPWLLVEALWKRGHRVNIDWDRNILDIAILPGIEKRFFKVDSGDTLSAALLQAAADMLRKEK